MLRNSLGTEKAKQFNYPWWYPGKQYNNALLTPPSQKETNEELRRLVVWHLFGEFH